MSLFGTGPRTDATPMNYGESRYEFLNRVKSEFFGNVRDLLEAWYSTYPDEGGRLGAGLRSDDDLSHAAAFWELYLYSAYVASGRTVEVHPDLGSGSKSRPDFLVHGSSSFVVEARLLMTSVEAQTGDARTRPLYDVVNQVASGDFFLWMSVLEIGESSPSLNSLKSKVAGWLESLDVDAVAKSMDPHIGLDSLPSTGWRSHGWEIELRAIPKKASARGKPSRLLGMTGDTEVNRIDDHTPFLRTLKAKSPNKYGNFDLPYVIAISSHKVTVDETDVFAALFGREAFAFTKLPDGEFDLTQFRQPDGFWYGPHGYQNTRVSGVLVAHGLVPWTVGAKNPRMWLNPYPAVALPREESSPWATAIPDIETGDMVKHPPPSAPYEWFGLPPGWPGPEDLAKI